MACHYVLQLWEVSGLCGGFESDLRFISAQITTAEWKLDTATCGAELDRNLVTKMLTKLLKVAAGIFCLDAGDTGLHGYLQLQQLDIGPFYLA